MREIFPTGYKALAGLCLALCFMLAGLAAAQTPAETEQAQSQTEQTAMSEAQSDSPDASPQTGRTSDQRSDQNSEIEIDLSDPALVEALEARDKLKAEQAEADRAVAEAIAAQRRKTVQLSEATPEKKSFIPTSAEEVRALGKKIVDKIIGWLTSPSFLAQVGAIVAAYLMAPILAGALKKRVFLFRDPPGEETKLRLVRDYIYRSRGFLRAAMLVALLAIFAVIVKAIPVLGQDWLVKLVQGLAVVFLLFSAIKTFITNELVRKLATWIVIPLALLIVFGYFDDLTNALNNAKFMEMGDTPITAMTLVRLAIFGGLFFWLGNMSNTKGQTAIRSQEGLDIGVREIVAKLFQILLFIILFVLILSFAGIPLSGLVVIFSAVGLGIGFGLQPIAANFISGLIILFDRSVKVGDFVLLPDGQSGHVEAINMRSTTVETADGKDIMVPNTKFTEEAYENWTHKDPSQRYEVEFTVHYDTDLDSLEDILVPAVLEHHQVLKEPELPDLELRGFGDSGVNMAIEFWCEGIDDGVNKFTSDVNFVVWRTLKKHGIKIPYPQREVRTIK